MPIPEDRFDQGNEDASILAEVELVSFDAEPSTIGPFGASVLQWEVVGPDGFTVRIDRRVVGRKGSLAVQPDSTRVFTLSARAGFLSRTLGQVTVNVDEGGCESFDVTDIRPRLSNFIRTQIDNDPDLTFRPRFVGTNRSPVPGGPIVKIEPGRIEVTLKLSRHVDATIDFTASVDIEASFGLDVADGNLVARRTSVSADVDVPWYLWLIPGAMLFLPLSLSNAEQDARASGQALVGGLAQFLDFASLPGEGRRRRSVRIQPAGDGILTVEHCADDLIRVLAAHSTKVVVE
jgi:hypothetical protein